MRCANCGTEMITTREDYRYVDAGLTAVVLRDVELRRCRSCGEEETVLRAIESIHREIARRLVAKPGRLAPEEIRFLRKHLEYSGTELAAYMGVTPETVSRWENAAKDMGVVADRLIRLLVVQVEQIRDFPLEAMRQIEGGPAEPLRMEIGEAQPAGKLPRVADRLREAG